MSGIGFSEFLILCMIGLIVLGPKRLPRVANQIGTWVGQARRMTRVMRRQLEEELDFDRDLNIRPPSHAAAGSTPRDDDKYSPLHAQPQASAVAAGSTRDSDTHGGDADESEQGSGAAAADEAAASNESGEADGDERRDA